MSTRAEDPKVQRITADEAVEALTRAAWTESISEEKYEAAVKAVLELAAHPEIDPHIPASEIRATVERELGAPRTLIHCYLGGFGADWILAKAIDLARRDGAQCAWAPNLFRHELAIFADGKMYRFDARRPAEPEQDGGE